MAANVWSVLIAALALGVSAISLIRTHKTESEQTQIQERLLAIEEKRENARTTAVQSAQVLARIERNGSDRALVIENQGPAHAKELRVLLDGKSLLEHDLIPGGQDEITELGPHGEARYLMAMAGIAASVVQINIRWRDASGIPGNWQSSLTLF